MNVKVIPIVLTFLIFMYYFFTNISVGQNLLLIDICKDAFIEYEKLIKTTDYAKMKSMTLIEVEKKFKKSKVRISRFNKEEQMQACKSWKINNYFWFEEFKEQ